MMTPEQIRAVQTPSREVLVFAGAGSGKTAVLAHRTLHLITLGASPSEMMLLTFTRRAAREMSERIERLAPEYGLNERAVQAIWVGTFHSAALRILREHGDRIGYDGGTLTVIDEDDSALILRQVAREYGFMCGDRWRGEGSLAKLMASIGRLYVGMADDVDEFGARVWVEYQRRLRDWNLIDFGGLLRQARRLLSEHPDVLASMQRRVRHVLVDEIQDTDLVQFDLHDFFSAPNGPASFTGVGDFRQSIYGWRGARPDLVLARHAAAEVIDLVDNFRSTPEIVSAGNSLISHADAVLGQPMRAARSQAEPVGVVVGDEHEVVSSVTDMLMGGVFPRDVAVIARTHATLRTIEGLLRDASIPAYRVGSGFDMLDKPAMRTLLAALRLASNTRDVMSLLWLLEHDDGQTYLAEVREQAARSGSTLTSAAAGLAISSPPASVRWAATAASGGVDGSMACVEVTSMAVRELGLPKECGAYMARMFGDSSVRGALQWLAMRDSQDDLAQGDQVTLLTAHAAKGLEWPCVVVANMNEGEMPSKRAIREGGIEEERRVAYVAMTRARDRLVLHARAEDESRFVGEALGKTPAAV